MLQRNTCSDSELARKIIDGDESAFRELFNRYRNAVYGYGFNFLKSKVYAEEIVQDVFLKIWETRDKIDPDKFSKSYVFTIARNRIFNFLRKLAYDDTLRQEVFYSRESASNCTYNQVLESDYDKLTRQAIKTLPPRRKLIYEMCRIEGMSHKEIARKLGISKNTVKDQMVKALQNIRNYFSKHTDIDL